MSSFYRFNKSFDQSLNDPARKKLNLYESELAYTERKTREYIKHISESILRNESISIIFFDFSDTDFLEEGKLTNRVSLRNLNKINEYAKKLKAQLKFKEKQQQALEVIYLHDRKISSSKLATKFSNIRTLKLPNFSHGHPLRFWKYVFKLSRGSLLLFCDIQVLYSNHELWNLLNMVRSQKRAMTYNKPTIEELHVTSNHIACYHSIKEKTSNHYRSIRVQKVYFIMRKSKLFIRRMYQRIRLQLDPSLVVANWNLFAVNKVEMNRYIQKIDSRNKGNIFSLYLNQTKEYQNFKVALKQQVFDSWQLLVEQLCLQKNFSIEYQERTAVSCILNTSKEKKRNLLEKSSKREYFKFYRLFYKLMRLVFVSRKMELRKISPTLLLIPIIHLTVLLTIILSSIYSVIFWKLLFVLFFLLPFSFQVCGKWWKAIINFPLILLLTFIL